MPHRTSSSTTSSNREGRPLPQAPPPTRAASVVSGCVSCEALSSNLNVTSPVYMLQDMSSTINSSAYASQRAGLRDGELRAQASRMLAEDDSAIPLPALGCLRSQVVVERAPLDDDRSSLGSSVSSHEMQHDPPPGYQLNPPLPAPWHSTLGSVQYTSFSHIGSESLTSVSSHANNYAESVTSGRSSPHLPIPRHQPRTGSPLRFMTAAEEDEEELELPNGAAADISAVSESSLEGTPNAHTQPVSTLALVSFLSC